MNVYDYHLKNNNKLDDQPDIKETTINGPLTHHVFSPIIWTYGLALIIKSFCFKNNEKNS